METKKETTRKTKLDSALALTRSETVQQYHVFAYILANDLETTDDDNPVYGSIIILASFSDYVDEKNKIVSGKKSAIKYANDQSAATGYELIFWTDTHKWFNLRKRAKVSEIVYVDDKTALENAIQYNNIEALKREKGKKDVELSIEEEKLLHRARCNPDHIEHFIDKLTHLNSIDNEIEECEKRLREAKILKAECLEKLKFHYQKHPRHAEDGITLLKSRLEASEFLPIACAWSRHSPEITSARLYEKKSMSDTSASNSLDVSSKLEADIIITEEGEGEEGKSEGKSEGKLESKEENEWKTTGRRRRRGKK